MTPVALDGSKLLILMAAGGTFALAGLWLMFRQPPAGEAAKIEIFGLKFQASSAGLIVFLIGAVFLAMPIVVPEKQAVVATGPVPPPAVGEPAKADGAARGPSAPAAQSAGPTSPAAADEAAPVRARATGREVEPNEQYEGANRLTLGDSVAGSLAFKEEDWFAMAAGGEQPRLEIRIRSNTQHCAAVYIQAYSSEERQLLGGAESLGEVNTSKTWTIDTGGAAWIFLRLASPISSSLGSCQYELFTRSATG